MKIKLVNKALFAAGLLTVLGASAFAAANPIIHSGSDFESLLKSPSSCTSAGACPSGAYFVDQSDYSDPAQAAAALYKLGTTIGGSQDGTVAGPATQWSKDRYAILIGSGTYDMVNPTTTTAYPQPFKIGYYTEITGVASNREDVVVAPGINSLNDCNESLPWTSLPSTCKTVGGLNNFWRSLGNLTIDSSQLLLPENVANPAGSKPNAATSLRFAISQAAPIRNVHFSGLSGNDSGGNAKGVLLCDWDTGSDCGYASGGFISDSTFSGIVGAGSQQQFYISNSTFDKWEAGTWNMVSSNNTGTIKPVGVDTNPTTKTNNQWSSGSGFPFTTVTNPVTVPHKPRLTYTSKDGSTAAYWEVSLGDSANTVKPISDFTILTPGTFSTSDINTINADIKKSTSAGLIIMPGIYNLQGVLDIPASKTVLGIGIPSLQCNSASGACMTTDSEGVRLAGLTFDAGTNSSNGGSTTSENTLLTVGVAGSGSAATPDVLQDVFCRIARTDSTMGDPSAYSCLTVNANHVIGQNLWLWRADHDDQSGTNPDAKDNLVPATTDQGQYGLIVNGNNVIMDALFVEHFQNYQTVWNGKDGQINFYQSEMPYLLPTGDATTPNVTCSTPDGTVTSTESVCPSLFITKNATNFSGQGLGIYSYFATQKAYAKAAIEIQPGATNVTIKHAVIRWLNGETDSGINSIVKDANGTYPASSTVNGAKNGYAIDTHSYTYPHPK